VAFGSQRKEKEEKVNEKKAENSRNVRGVIDCNSDYVKVLCNMLYFGKLFDFTYFITNKNI
jgi:hypothetical protein